MDITVVNRHVQIAQQNHTPIVALETAVLTHGLPHPENVDLALELEAIVRSGGAVPATIGMINGKIIVGLTEKEMKFLGDPETPVRKISKRDFGIAVSQQLNGGTTVCGTMIAARNAGITVFATGGIGGVHRNTNFDVSADLPQLATTPMVVVCAGAKSILDIPNTLEYLETHGIPVIGYQTDEFPAFFSRCSGFGVDSNAINVQQIADIASAHWQIGNQSAVLVVVPPPMETAIENDEIDRAIQEALQEAERLGIFGAETTPFLLSKVKEYSGGRSLVANLDLLKNNAKVAAKIAKEIQHRSQLSY